jgi:hypothetical protein
MDLILGLALSAHLGLSEDFYNEVHPHLRFVENKYVAGIYYNSIGNFSFYGGKRFEYNNLGFEVGTATGYEILVAPYARGTYDFNEDIRLFGTAGWEENNNELKAGIVIGLELMINS